MKFISVFPDIGLRIIMAGMGESIISKYAGSSDRVKIDLYNFLRESVDNNKIISWNTFAPDGIILSNFEKINDRFLTMIISGGEKGESYKIEVKVMMEDDQVWTVKIHLSVD